MSNRRRLDTPGHGQFHTTPSGLVIARRRTVRPALSQTSTKVRNVQTGRVLPCIWSDCQNDGNDTIRVETPHEAPRFRGEKLIYIFCSDAHRDQWIAETRKQ